MGELGAIGRLQPGALPTIAEIPIAMPQGPMHAPRRRHAGDPLVVALSGAFNPWFDDSTAAAGLSQAMAARPQLSVIVTGGGLPGFYEAGAQRFEAWATQYPERITLHGWAPHGQLGRILSAAHIGISLDRPGPEPELGSRTRLLSFIQHGLLPVATPGCALAQEMLDHSELKAVAAADPADLAKVLIALVDTDDHADAIERAQHRLSETYASDHIAQPVAAWAAEPTRAQMATLPAAALASELAQERDTLAQVHASPTWRTLSWLNRLVRRD
jgi:glycosyltransferase involved in cell wall biosynthesis